MMTLAAPQQEKPAGEAWRLWPRQHVSLMYNEAPICPADAYIPCAECALHRFPLHLLT